MRTELINSILKNLIGEQISIIGFDRTWAGELVSVNGHMITMKNQYVYQNIPNWLTYKVIDGMIYVEVDLLYHQILHPAVYAALTLNEIYYPRPTI